MAQITEVFQKGDMSTPQRFWEYALRTETKHGNKYHELGFMYSKKHTDEYIAMSDSDKNKVRFVYVNGEFIKY